MSFLAPLFLFGLMAAAIPVAIHLIRRDKPQRVMFSTLRFLKSTTRKLVLFQQIQQWLLLLMRAALIALLAVAFARPLLHQTPMAQLLSGEPESVVVLLDRSLSMRAGERFERARDEALGQIGELSPGDEAAVVSFASTPAEVMDLGTEPAQLREFIEGQSEPGYDVARFGPALRLADELLGDARHQRRRVVMVSDFQANALDEEDDEWKLSSGVTFDGIDVGGDAVSNLGFRQVRVPQQLTEGESERELVARVRSSGSEALEQGEISLRIDGEQQARQTLDMSEGTADARFPMDLESAGSRRGELVLSGDDFTVDNRYHFSVDVLPRVRVLVVNGDPSPNWYDDESHWFELALDGSGESPFVTRSIEAEELDAELLEEHNVVALLNVAQLSSEQQGLLIDHARQGGNLLLAPGDRVDAGTFNQQFGPVSPARLQEAVVLEDPDYLLVADIERRHPLIQPLEMQWNARFQGYWEMEPGDEARVLMNFDNAAPALVEGRIGQGRVLLFASSLDTNWNNLPLQSLYPPLMHESINYLVQPPSRQRQWHVADTIDLSGAAAVTSSPVIVERPDGSRVELPADDPVLSAREPGLLRAERGDAISWHAVNIQPGAGELESIAPSVLHDRIVNPDTELQPSGNVRTAQLLAELERPQGLWWWIVSLALALLFLETWIANRTYR